MYWGYTVLSLQHCVLKQYIGNLLIFPNNCAWQYFLYVQVITLSPWYKVMHHHLRLILPVRDKSWLKLIRFCSSNPSTGYDSPYVTKAYPKESGYRHYSFKAVCQSLSIQGKSVKGTLLSPSSQYRPYSVSLYDVNSNKEGKNDNKMTIKIHRCFLVLIHVHWSDRSSTTNVNVIALLPFIFQQRNYWLCKLLTHLDALSN